MEILEEKRKLSVDEVYKSVLKNKSAKEKIKLTDSLFEYAKKVNPNYFKQQVQEWISQLEMKKYENY